jgi:hypothetical protein
MLRKHFTLRKNKFEARTVKGILNLSLINELQINANKQNNLYRVTWLVNFLNSRVISIKSLVQTSTYFTGRFLVQEKQYWKINKTLCSNIPTFFYQSNVYRISESFFSTIF